MRSEKSFPLYKLRIIKKEIRKEFVVSKLAHGRISKFLLVGSNRMLVV